MKTDVNVSSKSLVISKKTLEKKLFFVGILSVRIRESLPSLHSLTIAHANSLNTVPHVRSLDFMSWIVGACF